MKKNLTKRLENYSKLAQGMAKPSLVSMAALIAANADGAVIHSGTQNIPVTWTTGSTTNTTVNIDIDGGGADLQFYGYNFGLNAALRINKQGNFNAAVAPVGGYAQPRALYSNYQVKSASNFRTNSKQYLVQSNFNSGFWRDGELAAGQTRFIGIRLSISGNTHYGWVRITKNGTRDFTIVDWAYENTVNEGILTGDPSLPVELVGFNLQATAKSILLSWTTAMEENNAGFEVQRSTDGETFQTLDFVEGAGTTLETQEYIFEDKNARTGQLYYYRLKQLDFDGQFEFSAAITGKIEGSAIQAGAIYPNPTVNGKATLEYEVQEASTLNIEVYNISGQLLLKQERVLASGVNNIELDFSTLAKGNYYVKLESGSERQYQKLIID